MIILGIDPGTARTGFGVIKASSKNLSVVGYGCIETPKEIAAADRLNLIHNRIISLIRLYDPKVLVLERLFFNRNAKTATEVGRAAGVIMLAAAKAKIPVFEYMPLQIKLMIDGYGRADKKHIQKKVVKILSLKKTPKPDDVADALAVAICHYQKIYGKLKKGGEKKNGR